MDISYLQEYMAPVIIGLCLCVGFVLKHWIKDVDNKYIPTLCAVIGLAAAVWVYWGNITPEAILTGIASGLASTGMHQAFTQLIHRKE